MAFNVREGIRGLEHLRLSACRKLFNMKPETFIEKHRKSGLSVEACIGKDGQPIKCGRCGFILMKSKLENDWQLECCSAFPVFSLKNPDFQLWMRNLAAQSLQSKEHPEISGTKSPDAILQDR
ncbi:MAG: hypothetical protein K2X27_07090 [Candidatus Obscuribacterales bacterium]|nr:hypothetical protein [Candidatus Obscuribacterales bacterium]